MKKRHSICGSLFLAVLFLFCLPVMVSAAEQENKPWEYGKVTGQLRYYYFTQRDKDKNTTSETIKESLAIGGFLKYETPWLEETLQGGIAGYTSQPFLSTFNESGKGGTGLLTSRNDGVTVLGEAYAKLKVQETVGTIFRQRIETPMVNGNDSRMIPQTYEAYSLTAKEVDDLTMQLAWIERVKLRDTDEFKHMSEVSQNSGLTNSSRGMFMVGGDWSPDALKTRAWYYHIPDYLRMVFLQAGSTHPVEEDLFWHWLVQGLDQRNTGASDGGSFNVGELGVLGGLTVSGVRLDIGGTIVDSTTNVVGRWGVNPFFNNMMSFANNRAGERTLYLSAAYDFSRMGWKGFDSSVKTTFADTPESGTNASPDRDEYNLNMNYAFDGDLKGLSIQNRWSYQETKGDKDGMQVRLRFQYRFQLL